MLAAMSLLGLILVPDGAEARCRADQIPQYNYETKKSDCIGIPQAGKVSRKRQVRQPRQPRRMQQLLQKQRQRVRELTVNRRQTRRPHQALRGRQRVQMQEVITRQRRLMRKQLVAQQL
jgi:hypothetical protein